MRFPRRAVPVLLVTARQHVSRLLVKLHSHSLILAPPLPLCRGTNFLVLQRFCRHGPAMRGLLTPLTNDFLAQLHPRKPTCSARRRPCRCLWLPR